MVMLALSSAAAFSAERAVLRNGFVMRLDHRETRGAVTRLFMDRGTENYVDIPGDQIVRFEAVPELPAVPVQVLDPVRTTSVQEIVISASNRYGIDPDLILSLIRAESAFDPKAVSPKGAQGLMQLMPQTATLLGVENPMDAAANVEGGTRYLRDLLIQYNQNLIKALAAYNAGPGRIEQYHGVPPYPETIAYITRIINDLNRRKVANANLSDKKSETQKKTATFKPSRTRSTSRPREIAESQASHPASVLPSSNL
jgi:hypothetical protein